MRLGRTALVAIALSGAASARASDAPPRGDSQPGGAALGEAAGQPWIEPPPGPRDPLAGVAGERAFLRSPDNGIVLLPNFRLQVGGAYFPRQEPKSGFFLRRARLEVAGWLGPAFYFDLGADVAGTSAGTVAVPGDAYVAFAPLGDLVIFQAGQFDAPFTLENRTLDPWLPFIERSLVVRSIAAPRNKEVGIMLHGADAAHTVYYSGGVFNGDGAGVRNQDNQVDLIGRVVVSPLARTSFEALHDISFGGSAWYGQHLAGQAFPTQTTPGGFVLFNPRWTTGRADMVMPLELRERGTMMAFGGEVTLPVNHLFGVRAEGVFKKQDLGEDAISPTDGATLSTMGRAKLQAIGGYADAWVWLLGDDRQLPIPGLQLPLRLGRVAEPSQRHALQLVARGELLKEDLTSTQAILGNPNLATTRVVSGSLAANYWYGRRVRVSMNYVLTAVSGTTENVKMLAATGQFEHELLFLLGMNL